MSKVRTTDDKNKDSKKDLLSALGILGSFPQHMKQFTQTFIPWVHETNNSPHLKNENHIKWNVTGD